MGHAAQAVSHSRQPRPSYAHQWIRQDKHLHGSRAVNVYLTNNKIPFSSARLEKKHSVVRNCHSWKSNLALVLVKRSGIQNALLVWDHFLQFIHYASVKVYRNRLLWDFTSYCSGMSMYGFVQVTCLRSVTWKSLYWHLLLTLFVQFRQHAMMAFMHMTPFFGWLPSNKNFIEYSWDNSSYKM